MNDWSTVFLGIIAVATLATAVIQIAVLIAAGMLTKRLGRLADQVERELTPLLASLIKSEHYKHDRRDMA